MLLFATLICLGIFGVAYAQGSSDTKFTISSHRPQYFQELQVSLHAPKNRTLKTYTNGSTSDTAILDYRYAAQTVAAEEQSSSIQLLLAAFFSTMDDLGVDSWLVHDTLLGWYENEKLLASTKKLDVQISSDSLIYLVKYYNMSVYHFDGHRDYLIDIHPNHRLSNGRRIDSMVDARWISMNNGVFLDITSVWKHSNQSSLHCNDGSIYNATDIYPLREVLLANATVKVPNMPRRILDTKTRNSS